MIALNRREFENIILKNAEDFLDYFHFPCIAAIGEKSVETSSWLADVFASLGARRVEKWTKQGGSPVVFSEFAGRSDRTVLFYNHYDVQPPEPLEEWKTDPFEPVVRDGRLIARGACDDKGELVLRLALVKYFQEHGGLPVGLKFFVEGEEEVGSPHVRAAVEEHVSDLKCDACIWEGGARDANGRFEIVGGLKGIAAFEASVKTASGDLHSSKSCYAPNAAVRLVQGLSSLFDSSGRLSCGKCSALVQNLTPTEEKFVEGMDVDERKLREDDGIIGSLITDDVADALVNEPSLSINGLSAGYEGDGVKTIIPCVASAKLDCRLSPSQDPASVFEAIRSQLVENGYPDIRLTYVVGQPGYRADVSSEFVRAALGVAQEVFGDDGVSYVLNSPIAGPAYAFGRTLAVPLLGFGIGYPGQKMHAPNENIRLADFCAAGWYMLKLLERMAG